MHWDYGWGMGFGIGWILNHSQLILNWVLIILGILGIVYLVKAIAGSAKKGEKEESALDILKKRYARGDINKEEFERMKDDLMKS
jgi:putative membrane protein